jgi:hypothetical protein
MKNLILLSLFFASSAVWCTQAAGQSSLANVVESGGAGYPSGTNPGYLGVEYGADNFVLGYYAGTQITTGDGNVALGPIALQVDTTGAENTAVGYGALTNAVSSNFDVAVGYLALSSIAGSGAGDSDGDTALGYEAQELATGKNNVGVGAHALLAATGNRNTAVGTDTASAGISPQGCQNCAGSGSWSGSDNATVGHDSMGGWDWEGYLLNEFNNLDVSGSMNACLGEACLVGLTTASYNVGVGYQALGSNSTGNNNVGIGYLAGVSNVDANRNIGGSQNTWVGTESGTSTTTQLDNCVAVGYEAKCSQSNQSVIGNSSTTQAVMHGDPHFWSVFVPGFAYECGSKTDGNPVASYSRCGLLSLPIAMTVTQISFSFTSGGTGYGAALPTYTVYDGTNKCSVQWTQSEGEATATTGTPTGNCSFPAGDRIAIVLNGSYSSTLDAQNANITVTLTP